MTSSPELNSIASNITDTNSSVSTNSKTVDIHPLAFTIEFNDQKVDEARKSKVQERLSAFSLRHRRNPSLPDFNTVRNGKSSPVDKLLSPPNSQHVPIISKGNQKSGKVSESQWKSSALKAVKNSDLKSPMILKSLEVNSAKNKLFTNLARNNRRSSLNDIDYSNFSCQKSLQSNGEYGIVKNEENEKNADGENKSDTVSEAGTYTVDKEDESPDNEANQTQIFVENYVNDENEHVKINFRSSWINDWVRDVEEQNLRNPVKKEAPNKNSDSGRSSPGVTKIPSPINTLGRKAKLRGVRSGDGYPVKMNGSVIHRYSSSHSAKDYNENHGSESSLETESFLRTTESVVTAMQNRMRLSLDGRTSENRKTEKKNFNYKERPHPPSTASDTDTNSESDTKAFKKPTGNPFARLNRAFSLRRAKADTENDVGKKKSPSVNNKNGDAKNSTGNGRNVIQGAKSIPSKPPPSTPFSRTDCGRFSMRSTPSSFRSVVSSQRKETKKSSNGNNRSASTLSSREVEFQNWRRRKSFDPMKAAAEGRKKELAKKAAMNQSMTQSINLGNGTRGRSLVNPVLRSASFHSTAQVFQGEEDDEDEDRDFQDQGSTDEQEESAPSSWISSHHSLRHNSPNKACGRCTLLPRLPTSHSRCSLVSETHSSPSRRLRSDDLDSLVMTAISDLSSKLKFKSCSLLKKLNYLYDPNDEKSFRLREEIAVLESKRNSAQNSPIHQATSRDLSSILKNLKGLENVLRVLDDVLFEENLEIYVNE